MGDQRLGVDRALGHDEATGPVQLGALLVGPRQDDGLGALQPGEDGAEQVVLEAVVQRDGRRGPHDGDRLGGIEAELVEDRRVGLEVGQVVLLLQARVGGDLALCAIPVQPLGGDQVGNDDGLGQAAVDRVLDGRPLVVERRRARDPQQRRGDRHVVGAMPEREVKAPSAGWAGGPFHERKRAIGQAARLGAEAGAPVAADRRVRDPEAVAQSERLGEVARGYLHLMAVGGQPLDDRPHDEHVRRVGEVDPDPHRARPRASPPRRGRRRPRRPARRRARG
jgi:hypothetical protein